jgi:peptidoglycan/xylan/chitin deacetylase (PgdA/CDA1 family)
MSIERFHRTAQAILAIILLLGSASGIKAADNEALPGPYDTKIGKPAYGPYVPASVNPEEAPRRDPSLWPRGYYSGDPLPPKTIYLTFDDGPWEFTSQIVDILHEEGVRATFFMNSFDKDNPFHADTGQNLMFRFSDVLKRMVADGNVIGNHTYSHRDLGSLSPSQIDFQLSTLQRQLKEALGDKMPTIHLIRPPFGSPWLGHWSSVAEKRKVTAAIRGRGIVMMWTIGWDSGDSVNWAKGEWYESTNARYHPGSATYDAKMRHELARIFRRADGRASGIILMHDTHPTSRDILKPLIEELKRRGYTFATLEDYCRWRWGPHVFDALDRSAAAAVGTTATSTATLEAGAMPAATVTTATGTAVTGATGTTAAGATGTAATQGASAAVPAPEELSPSRTPPVSAAHAASAQSAEPGTGPAPASAAEAPTEN